MKSLGVLTVVTLLLAICFVSISAKTQSLTGAIVPFQLISPAEYKAIVELNNGNPFITQNRLINSGSQAVNDILNNIINGLIRPVNLTGLDPIYNSIFKPASDGKAQGYPLCTIQTNRNAQHTQRSYDAVVDPASNFGTFSINFYHPGTVNIDNYDEDISIDEVEPSYQKPTQAVGGISNRPTTKPYPDDDDVVNKNKNEHSSAPIVNCVVVLKQPPTPPTSQPTPTPTQHPPMRPLIRPSYYPAQFPAAIMTPHHPTDSNYPISAYQVVPIPYPPYLGLIAPAGSSNTPSWPNWSSSQGYVSASTPGSVIPPTWPYWTVGPSAAASQSNNNKNPQPSLTWPFMPIPSHHMSTQNPTSPPYVPSTFWTTINPDDEIPVPSPSFPINSNPTAWFRPPGALKRNLLKQQQHHNEHANDEGRAALHDQIAPEIEEIQGEHIIGDVVDAIQTSEKKQSGRIRENNLRVLPHL